jgi:hypothetical protein
VVTNNLIKGTWIDILASQNILEQLSSRLLRSLEISGNSYLFNEFVYKLGFFWYDWARPTSANKVQFTQERVEYKVFLFDDHLKGSKSLKIFKINLTFRFDKLSHFLLKLPMMVIDYDYCLIIPLASKKQIVNSYLDHKSRKMIFCECE